MHTRCTSQHLWLLLSAALLTSCGVDTDTLICARGRTVVDGTCQDIVVDVERVCVEAEDWDVPGSLEEGDACSTWEECSEGLYCSSPDDVGFRWCRARCESEGCPSGAYCSVAGQCLTEPPEGGGDVGATCDSDNPCAINSVCAPEDQLCHLVCDPRASEGCSEGDSCGPLSTGLGRCFETCS